jgi:hypothetical protein
MATKWSDLSPRTRKVIMTAGVIDAGLRTAALFDLKRRPSGQVRGSKRAWACAIAVGNSAGVLPVVYFVRGRRQA